MQSVANIVNAHGGTTAFAKAIGTPVGTVSAWISRNRIPASRVPQIERAMGISRQALRPDLWTNNKSSRSHSDPGEDLISISVPRRTIENAKDLGADLSHLLATVGLDAVRKELKRLWNEQNAEAIKARNAYFEKHGLPLEKYRTW